MDLKFSMITVDLFMSEKRTGLFVKGVFYGMSLLLVIFFSRFAFSNEGFCMDVDNES